MSSLGDLLIRVGANIDGFEQSMGTISQRLNAVDREASRAFSGLDKIAGRLGDVATAAGTALTAGLTVPLAGISYAAVNLAGSFEASFNKIKALGDDITGPSLERLRAQALQLGKDTKFSAQQAADGMTVFASAGHTAEQILAEMPGTLALAAAGMFSIEEAAELTKNALGQFQIESRDAGVVADVLAQISADTSAKMADLGNTLTYVGPVAHGAGQSLQETGAAMIALDKAGIQAEKAGTGLRGVLGSLLGPSKEAQKTLDELGITVSDSSGRILPLSDIMEQFRVKLSTVGTEAEKQRIVFDVFGREAGNAAQVLIQTGGPALDAFEQKLINSGGAADRMAKTMNQGLNYSLEQFKGSVETAGIALGTALLPVVGRMIDMGTKLVNDFLLPAANYFAALPAPVQNAALAIAAAAAAAGPVLLITGQLATSVTALLPAVTSLAGAFGLTAAGAGPLAGLLGGLAAALPVVAALAAGLAVAWAAWKYQDDIPGIQLLKLAFEALSTAIVFEVEMVKALAGAVSGLLPSMGGLLDVLKFILTPQRLLLEGLTNLTSAIRGLRAMLDDVPSPAKAAAKSLSDLKAKSDPVGKSLKLAAAGLDEFGRPIPKVKTDAEKLAASMKKLGGETDEVKTSVGGVIPKNEILAAQLRILQAEHSKTVEEVAKYRVRVAEGKAETVDFSEVLRYLTTDVKAAGVEIKDIASIHAPAFITKVSEAAGPVVTLQSALGSLGIKGKADLRTVADEAAKARDAVLGSGLASDFEKKTAIYKALEAQIEYARVAGIEIPAEQRKLFDELDSQLGDRVPKMKTPWSDFGSSVSTIITNTAQDITKSLFDGNLSFAEKGKAALQSLGEAVVSSFIEPATKAIGDFIGGVLSDLLGGKGFGGVLDKLKDLGSGIGGVFSGGSTPSAPSGGSVPSGGGGGGIGSGTSGLGGTVDIITGAISAAANVISAIYNVRIEGTLNQIERNTAAASIHLQGILERANEFWPSIRETHALIGDTVVGVLREIRDGLKTLFSVNVNLTGDEQKALVSSLISRVGTFDTVATDRLLDIYARAGEINRTIQDGSRLVSNAITSAMGTISGGLANIEKKLPSTLENALGGNIAGGLAGIAGTLPAAISGLIAGLVRGSGKTDDLIEENTRFAAIGIIGPAGVVDSLRTFLPVQQSIADFNYSVAAPWMAEMQAYIEGGLTDRIMQVHDLIASTTNNVLTDIRNILQAPRVAVAGTGSGGDNYYITAMWDPADPTGLRKSIDNIRRGL